MVQEEHLTKEAEEKAAEPSESKTEQVALNVADEKQEKQEKVETKVQPKQKKAATKPAKTKEPVKQEQDKQEQVKKEPAKKVEEQKQKEEKPVAKETYGITYDKESREWVVKKTGSSRASKRFVTKAEALEYAEKLSESKGANLRVHKKDGKFQKR